MKQVSESRVVIPGSKTSTSDSEYDDNSSSENLSWVEVDMATTVEDAMKAVLVKSPSAFYLNGQRIMKMVKYKLERGWTRECESVA